MEDFDAAPYHGRPLEDYYREHRLSDIKTCKRLILCVTCWREYRLGDRLCKVYSHTGDNLVRLLEGLPHKCPYCGGSWFTSAKKRE